MPKRTNKPDGCDLTFAELYLMHRAIGAMSDLEGALRRRWGARNPSVLHLDAIGEDLDDVFMSESTEHERTVIAKYFEAEQLGNHEIQAMAVSEMNDPTKPG